jgi:hypothetical protein
MAKTTQLLTRPAQGTVVKPVYEYDEGQKEKLQALREVSLCCTYPSFLVCLGVHPLTDPSFSLDIVVRPLAPSS